MSIITIGKFIDILLIDDNPRDVRLTREARKKDKVLNNLDMLKSEIYQKLLVKDCKATIGII